MSLRTRHPHGAGGAEGRLFSPWGGALCAPVGEGAGSAPAGGNEAWLEGA